MIITRQEALKRGLSKYFSGEPCVHGHLAERWTRNYYCVECKRIQKNKQREKQRQERIATVGNTGQTRYFTGESCVNGHIAERFIGNGRCVVCHKEQNEKHRRKKGSLPQDERNKKLREATKKKKALKSEKHKESLLTTEEKNIVEYARTCLSRLNGRIAARIPTEVAEIECGYTSGELHQHLKNQKKGWGLKENRKRWHIDHTIPISKLVKFGVTEVSILNSLDNLKLLTAKQNAKKHSKLRMSQKKFEEYVVLKWSSCPQVLGMYDPRQRRRRLVEEVANQIYDNLKKNVLQRSDLYRHRKDTIFQAIKDDLYDDNSWLYWRYSKGATFDKFINHLDNYYADSPYWKCSKGTAFDKFMNHLDTFSKLGALLLESYKPLSRLERRNFKSFKYKEDCEKYFQELAKKESNLICKRYLEKQVYEKCRFCRKKGFFKKLFTPA
jgi:hypothetical protein